MEEQDFVTDIENDLKKLDYNKYRFYNEPNTWYDRLMKDVETWYFDLPDVQVFKKIFTTKKPWIQLNPLKPIIRSQYLDEIKGKPIKVQWTLKATTELEFAALRIDTKKD